MERPGTATEVESILKEVNIPKDRLEFYLNSLYEVGLLEYSRETQTVKLTRAGREKDSVFMR
jgi:predicted transcriptional regulator